MPEELENTDKQETKTEESVEASEESTESSTKTEKETETEELFEGLSRDDLSVAANLYKALNSDDPDKQKRVVQSLAGQLGITLTNEGSNKKAEDKESGKTRSIKQMVEEKLPTAYKVLAPVMTELFEEYTKDFLTPNISAIQHGKQIEYESNAIDYLVDKVGEGKVAAVSAKMQKMAQRFKPGDLKTQADYNDYILNIYKLSAGDESSKETINKTLQKTKQNADRAKPGPSDVTRVKRGSKPITPGDAIRMALEGKEFEQ